GAAWEVGIPKVRGWLWNGSGHINDLTGLIPKNLGWTLIYQPGLGINDAGQIVGTGNKTGYSTGVAFFMTPGSAPNGAAPTANSGITSMNARNVAPLPTAPQSLHPLTIAPTSSSNLQRSPILMPLTPLVNQDFTLLGGDPIHSEKKRSWSVLRG